MQFKNIFILAACLSVPVANAFAVVWPDGHTPSRSEHNTAVAKAQVASERSEPPQDNHLTKRASASGCVQAHCGGAKGTTADFWVTYYEIEVWKDGKLILYLMSKTGKQQVWSAMHDPLNQQWGWRMTGDCGKMEYLNTYQNQYGWYTLNQPVNKHLKEKKGGWCFGGKNGDKCRDAEYWESVYTDNSQCGGRANPKTCDYAGCCVNVDGIPAYGSN
ncbi:hypothetical protein BKA61DRAFT_686636 [Leptodontidium sp. MPI-SDFR-AT-0119]|nr:hypothetical protein BKA61DRAFT_686636 [Leptodontidium sp. MPI-SDFR-AT-0119]